MKASRLMLVATCLALSAGPLAAQQNLAQPGPDTSRARLENLVRQRLARAVRTRIGLNDDQMTRLQAVSAKYEQQRRPLALEERSTRLQLRGLVLDERNADQKQVDVLLNRMIDIQKRRIAIIEAEQRDLSGFMTPVQRAKYLAMQEQIRRRVDQLQDGRIRDDAGAPAAVRPRALIRQRRPGVRRMP